MEKIRYFWMGFLFFSLTSWGGELSYKGEDLPSVRKPEELGVLEGLYQTSVLLFSQKKRWEEWQKREKEREDTMTREWGNLLKKSLWIKSQGKSLLGEEPWLSMRKKIQISRILENLFPPYCDKETAFNIIQAWVEDYGKLKTPEFPKEGSSLETPAKERKVFRMNSGASPYFSYTKEGTYSIQDFNHDVSSLRGTTKIEEFNEMYGRLRRKIMAHAPCHGLLVAEGKDQQERVEARLSFINEFSECLHSEMWETLHKEFLTYKKKIEEDPSLTEIGVLPITTFPSCARKSLKTVFTWGALGIGVVSWAFWVHRERGLSIPFHQFLFQGSHVFLALNFSWIVGEWVWRYG